MSFVAGPGTGVTFLETGAGTGVKKSDFDHLWIKQGKLLS